MNVLLVNPKYPDTFWSFTHALRFISKRAAHPPLGLLTVAALLPSEWTRKVVDMNVSRLNDEEIQEADFVFISAMSVQQSSAIEVIQRCRSLKTKIVAGGPLFTEEFENFDMVDHLILNEAEITLPLFIHDLDRVKPGKYIGPVNMPISGLHPLPIIP